MHDEPGKPENQGIPPQIDGEDQNPSANSPDGNQVTPPPAAGAYGGYEREDSGLYNPPPDFSGPPTGYAHYPRYSLTGYGPVPPGPPIVRFSALGEAWELIRQDLGTYVLAMLIYCVIGYTFSQITQVFITPFITFTPSMTLDEIFLNPVLWVATSVWMILTELLLFVLGAGYFSICLRRLRGEPISVANLFDGFKFFGRLLFAAVVTTLIRLVAMLALFLPGIIAAGAFAFVPLIIIDQKAGAFESIALSFAALKKDILMMGLLCLVSAAIAIAGLCGLCVLVLFSGPIYYMAIAIHYHAYFPPQGGPEEVPIIQVAPQYSV